jgi:hypothetical protein
MSVFFSRDISDVIAASLDCPREYPPPGNIEKSESLLYGESRSVLTARLDDSPGFTS